MTDRRNNLRGERGMILIMVMLLLSLLMTAGMAAVVSVQNDLRITANLRGAAAASYLADAGIEWGKQRIAAATTMPPTLSNGTHRLTPGSYTVSFLSISQTTPLSATVMLRSEGSTANARQVVHARVAKIYDLADGAIALRGNARSINVASTSFSISGLDHDLLTSAPLPHSRAHAAITVGAPNVLNSVESALDPVKRKNIVGDDGNGAALAVSGRILGNDIARLANELCAAPNAIVSAVPPLGSLSVTSQAWGSRTDPQLRCIIGLPSSDDSVMFGANTGGAGILVIRDAELVLTGDFRWEGWIVVSGSDVGFRVAGADTKELLGGLIIHESGNATGSGPAMLDIQGPVHMRLSRQGFNLAAALVPAATLSASYPALPFLLKQDYWRSIAP